MVVDETVVRQGRAGQDQGRRFGDGGRPSEATRYRSVLSVPGREKPQDAAVESRMVAG
jgi:hypothetical protein